VREGKEGERRKKRGRGGGRDCAVLKIAQNMHWTYFCLVNSSSLVLSLFLRWL